MVPGVQGAQRQSSTSSGKNISFASKHKFSEQMVAVSSIVCAELQNVTDMADISV